MGSKWHIIKELLTGENNLDNRQSAINFAADNKTYFLNGLDELIRIPSVSTDPEHVKDINKAAQFLADKLKSLGVGKIQINPTKLHPIVTGEYLHAGADQPTILIYGHYDVQPADPVELWDHDPFNPITVGDYHFARGASDMKGQVWATISAIESIMKTGEFPVNLKFVFEGEEEIGSLHFSAFVKQNKDLLQSTVCFNPDAGMVSPVTPTIVYGLRGLAYFELKIFGPAHDLHSGSFGGVIHNPAQVLAEIIAGMHDSDCRITLPDFYKKVRALSSEERKELARLNLGDEFYIKQTSVPALWGEKGYTSLERTGARPTLEINGLYSGFTGEGSKTIIPAWSMAKISSRLVPDQDPDDVHRQLLTYLEKHMPKTVKYELKYLSGCKPSISNTKSPESIAFAKALKSAWGVPPIYKREGGSVGVVTDLQNEVGVDSILGGFGLPDDNIHAPNERLHLPTWYIGIDALIHFFYNLKK
jgi:acetylornithine deacetylase/succinyl-diaminopimelate desuccinylase-like protein